LLGALLGDIIIATAVFVVCMCIRYIMNSNINQIKIGFLDKIKNLNTLKNIHGSYSIHSEYLQTAHLKLIRDYITLVSLDWTQLRDAMKNTSYSIVFRKIKGGLDDMIEDYDQKLNEYRTQRKVLDTHREQIEKYALNKTGDSEWDQNTVILYLEMYSKLSEVKLSKPPDAYNFNKVNVTAFWLNTLTIIASLLVPILLIRLATGPR